MAASGHESPGARDGSTGNVATALPGGTGRLVMLKKYVPLLLASPLVLAADLTSKAWALANLSRKRSVLEVVPGHLDLRLTHNRGGAWGFLESAPDSVRVPFFLIVSALAVAFILALYRKVRRDQRALRMALPLVLGGALGNASDRILRVGVVDFIDYRADWVLSMNSLIAKVVHNWVVVNRWPIFNVADVAICVGVGLMIVDVLLAKRGAPQGAALPPPLVDSSHE